MIDREKVYSYIEKYHGPVKTSTNGWHTATCPFCGKEKLAINFDQLVAKCWRGCFKGFVIDLIQSYHGITRSETRELIDHQDPGLVRIPNRIIRSQHAEMSLPNGYTPILSGDSIIGDRARRYLKGRGFDLNYMDRLGVGYCTESDEDKSQSYFGYIIIPFKRKGLLVYYIGRDYIDGFPRYKNPSNELYGIGKAEVFFNEEALYLYDKVYITEGWADAATLGNIGSSIQGSIPSTIQKNIILKSDAQEIIMVPDAGFYMKGLQAAKEIMNRKKVKVLNLDCLQTSGKGKDINEVGKELIFELERNTPYMSMSLLYKELKAYAQS